MTTLRDAVIEHMGMDVDDTAETLRDVAHPGADAGFPGFCYYTATGEFYNAHKGLIWDALAEDAEAFGYDSPADLVASFRTKAHDGAQFENLLAWYALERVAGEVE